MQKWNENDRTIFVQTLGSVVPAVIDHVVEGRLKRTEAGPAIAAISCGVVESIKLLESRDAVAPVSKPPQKRDRNGRFA